jgi:hypothetical protein
MNCYYQICIRKDATGHTWQNLAPVLEGVLPVKFIFSGMAESDGVQVAGEIITDLSAEPVASGFCEPVSSFSLPADSCPSPDSQPVNIRVDFQDDPDVPFPFRGRTIRVRVAAQPRPLVLRGYERVLAVGEQGPVWTVAEVSGVKHFVSAFALPGFGPESSLKDVLNEWGFMEMLPLICWLREICRPMAYAGPPLRACFIFDDPNLHWTHYGFVNYREMAEHAARENYHVAFATIPLDAWFAHKSTARLFRNNARQLSLMVHGNDHTKQELARDYAPSDRVALLVEAMHRIACLENRADVPVSRVMVPPHGACSEAMLAELPRCGFEAACISHGSLRAHNAGKSWTRHLGYFPSELVQGCPVLPRWGLSGQVENAVLLAAFLGQPMIFRGHHQDLKNGIELLDDLAGFINRLGSVVWSNMTDLCRMNYQWRLEGDVFWVKPLGRKLLAQVPDQARQLVIEGAFPAGWDVSGINGEDFTVRAGEPVALPGSINRQISISATSPLLDQSKNGRHRTTAHALLRRLLTEGRDRLIPFTGTH